MKKIHFGLVGLCLIGGLAGVAFCLYLFMVMMSAMGFASTHVITNDLGYTVEVRTIYKGRGRHEAYKCSANLTPCVERITSGQTMSLSGDEDGQPDYLILTLDDGTKEARCINGQIDNYTETELEARLNWFRLKGLSVYQSNISQHTIAQTEASGFVRCGK